MDANEYQIGGEHYKTNYEHWDFITDCNLHYLIGCATKYICRWRKKGGPQDLSKALHYVQKCEERGIENIGFSKIPWYYSSKKRYDQELKLSNFLITVENTDDVKIIWNIVYGHYEKVFIMISDLISEVELKSSHKE